MPNIIKTLVGLALAALVAAALACGPATPAGQDTKPTPPPPPDPTTRAKVESLPAAAAATVIKPTPTYKLVESVAANKPTPTLDPTVRAKVESLAATVAATVIKPTPTPKPVESDAENKPTPTRHPGDPARPTPTPRPTPAPLPTASQTRTPIAIIDPPHPDGLEGCKRFNIFSSNLVEMNHLGWCQEALISEVQTRCSGLNSSEDELACAEQFLADVQEFFLREVLTPCTAITDRDAHYECGQTTLELFGHSNTVLWQTWQQVIEKVSSDPAVKVAMDAMADCVEERGFDRPEVDADLPWQRFDGPKKHKERRAATSEEQRAYQEQIAMPAHECAAQVGLYQAQETAWITEIHRLIKEEPDKAKPYIERGILRILKEPGIAPFLTLSQFSD